jgi:hypothetical protein
MEHKILRNSKLQHKKKARRRGEVVKPLMYGRNFLWPRTSPEA